MYISSYRILCEFSVLYDKSLRSLDHVFVYLASLACPTK
jgi:hypothetical protein